MIPFAVVGVITLMVVWKFVSRPLLGTRNSDSEDSSASAPALWSGDGGTPIGGLHHHPWSSHGAGHDCSGSDGHDCSAPDGGSFDAGDCSGGDGGGGDCGGGD